jgi:hypothetical protein
MRIEPRYSETEHCNLIARFQRAADAGDAQAMYNLGICFQLGTGVVKDEKQVVDWFRKAAVAGDALAMRYLAAHLDDGVGVEKDEQQAVEWLLCPAVVSPRFTLSRRAQVHTWCASWRFGFDVLSRLLLRARTGGWQG